MCLIYSVPPNSCKGLTVRVQFLAAVMLFHRYSTLLLHAHKPITQPLLLHFACACARNTARHVPHNRIGRIADCRCLVGVVHPSLPLSFPHLHPTAQLSAQPICSECICGQPRHQAALGGTLCQNVSGMLSLPILVYHFSDNLCCHAYT